MSMMMRQQAARSQVCRHYYTANAAWDTHRPNDPHNRATETRRNPEITAGIDRSDFLPGLRGQFFVDRNRGSKRVTCVTFRHALERLGSVLYQQESTHLGPCYTRPHPEWL